jgi:hypothetical protein
MSTTVHTPAFVDYDAVERLTQFLIMAAQRRQVMFYWQAVAACQGGDMDSVLRGHIQVDKEHPPTNETMLQVIGYVAQVCKDKAWPPLTTLITKDGRTVSTGFWTNSPVGDLSGVADDYKRRIELHWREQCYAYFDAFSAMNTGLSGRLRIVRKAIEASKTQFPQLQQAFDDITIPTIAGVRCPLSLSSVDALVRKGITLTADQSAVLAYDDDIFVSPPSAEVELTEKTVLLSVGSSPMDFIRWAFKRELKSGNDVISVTGFEIVQVLSETQENLEFTAETRTVSGSGSWHYSADIVMEDLNPNIMAPRTANLTVRIDPAHGVYEAACSDIRVTNIIARITAHID